MLHVSRQPIKGQVPNPIVGNTHSRDTALMVEHGAQYHIARDESARINRLEQRLLLGRSAVVTRRPPASAVI